MGRCTANQYGHPLGFPPPADWFTPDRPSVSSEEYQVWIRSTKPPAHPLRPEGEAVKRHHKYAANAGIRADLGLYLRSSLENNLLRLLIFEGYELWTDKENPPPQAGKWVRYEGRTFVFEIRDKVGNLKQIQRYLADFEVWDHGVYRVMEAKGYFTPKSKTIVNRMRKYYPDVVYRVITADDLNDMKTEAFAARRRQHSNILEIPGWE